MSGAVPPARRQGAVPHTPAGAAAPGRRLLARVGYISRGPWCRVAPGLECPPDLRIRRSTRPGAAWPGRTPLDGRAPPAVA